VGQPLHRFALLYIGWIALCALLFVALHGRPDPSRRSGRILSDEAGIRAVALLRHRDSLSPGGYEAVHVAWAPRGEGGTSNRWVVLCDRVPHSGLREALVVELDGVTGSPLVIRRPVR
jgi:hypothetical protein